MTDDDKRSERRHPVALRIKLRYTQVGQFISKFATNLSRGGMFLSSRNPRPIGSKLYFELVLADDSPAIAGTGEVRWVQEYDRDHPDRPHGMGIKFIKLSEGSQAILERAIALRVERGDDDVDEVPGPPGSLQRRPAVRLESEPEPEPEPEPEVASRREPTVDFEAETRVQPPEAALVVAATPSPPRRQARVTELLADAASDVVDASGRRVADAIRQARELARDLAAATDDDLAGLLDRDAIPTLSVDEASRELASRLGGSAVDSTRYRAPRLATVEPAAAPERLPTLPAGRAETIDAALHALEVEGERVAEAQRAELDEVLAELGELGQGSLAPARPGTEIPIEVDDDAIVELDDDAPEDGGRPDASPRRRAGREP